MDCLSRADDGEYNCTNLLEVNCINNGGFNITLMWEITLRILQYCPSDPRLWQKDNIPITRENAALTGPACKAIVGSTWQIYPTTDIWVRLTTWKFPLFQLVASSPRPPLGSSVEGFVILHLLGDPVGTVKDLLRTISSCQERADFWRTYIAEPQPDKEQLNSVQKDHLWKAFTIITISYDEWRKGDEVQETLKNSLERFLATGDSAADLQTFLQLCTLTADALAADRSTRFLPIIVAQCFFVGAIAVAFAKLTSSSSSIACTLSIEVHSLAFSALYFWILPAVFLSSIIGVSQTQNAVPRILKRLQTGFNHELPNSEIVFPNHVFDEEQIRLVSGGIYSWQPEHGGVNELKHVRALLRRNLLPLMIVIAGTLTAWLVSGLVPPDGWEPRLCSQAMILLTWLLSFLLTCILKCKTSSSSYNNKGRFWLTTFKDLLVTIATVGGIIVTQVGILNRCDSYSPWDRGPLALPCQPDTLAVIDYRLRTVYPAIVFTSIGLQMFVVPIIIAIWYRHALLVFLQRDDGKSSPLWFLEWRWLKSRVFLSSRRHRPQSYDSEPQGQARIIVANDGTQSEEVKFAEYGNHGC